MAPTAFFYYSQPIPLRLEGSLPECVAQVFSAKLKASKPQPTSRLCPTWTWGYKHFWGYLACGMGAGFHTLVLTTE